MKNCKIVGLHKQNYNQNQRETHMQERIKYRQCQNCIKQNCMQILVVLVLDLTRNFGQSPT